MEDLILERDNVNDTKYFDIDGRVYTADVTSPSNSILKSLVKIIDRFDMHVATPIAQFKDAIIDDMDNSSLIEVIFLSVIVKNWVV